MSTGRKKIILWRSDSSPISPHHRCSFLPFDHLKQTRRSYFKNNRQPRAEEVQQTTSAVYTLADQPLADMGTASQVHMAVPSQNGTAANGGSDQQHQQGPRSTSPAGHNGTMPMEVLTRQGSGHSMDGGHAHLPRSQQHMAYPMHMMHPDRPPSSRSQVA